MKTQQVNPSQVQAPDTQSKESMELTNAEQPEVILVRDLGAVFSIGLSQSATRPAPASNKSRNTTLRPSLGTDFTHVIVTR